MARPKKLIAAGATFSVALGIGFIMQYGDALASRWGADEPVAGPATRGVDIVVPSPVSASVAFPQSLPVPQSQPIVTTPSTVAFEPFEINAPLLDVPSATEINTVQPTLAAADVGELPLANDVPAPEAAPLAPVQADACAVTLTATTGASAIVSLDLAAPCHADLPVAFHHQGMMFHMITDTTGQVSVQVPALAEDAYFIAAFDDGEGAIALTAVPEIAQYDRAVLQWQGQDGVQLHALEFGAGYGEDGHLWAETPGNMRDETAGGFLTRLGNPAATEALMAEVYTFPTGMVSTDGAVALSVEAEVTQMNCGREVAAQSIQISPTRDTTAMDLIMQMPACEAVGDFLVLKNMFEDLTLAAR